MPYLVWSLSQSSSLLLGGMIEILILYNQYISSIFHGKTIK
ncbi:hypothetical protein ACIN5162_1392 [Acinetobacter baumannii OIFC0162]|uniref:Putative membrane protein n=1 Tax=Acinetobacter baumannii 1499986 TaxID=1310673 RepID=A0A836YM40_ACIBA|nr:hypothetical protein BJAB0715_01426 [Acinetobacter baumannii BJAB0715]EJG13530.1 hypothetical protein ACIN3137_A0263 [Acinetobacter baumannii OIFC137]EJG22185.1 hypothetical protein ACIN5143_A2065 [Acinetobacter baumannii OIFC143]EJG26850.1 hypothetical protein ACIN5109_3726 [Acinetobacter baumannii OIFC109]EJO42314.1 hypothetical protein ACINIS123_2711 [Acinetobacter baumannii IS-123]EJP48639.1 hypothetical protein ACINNAV18_1564 [Acinetobacter baumannii Naval-18]EJP59200.1 hypothetical p